MTKLGSIQKYSKGRYILHNKVIICKQGKLYSTPIEKIVYSPRSENNKYVITKSSILKTQEGNVIVINKPSKNIPLGKLQ